MDEQREIIDIFTSQCNTCLNEKGIFPYPLIWEEGTKFNIGIMDVPPQEVTKFAMDALLLKGANRVIWGLDRINKNPEENNIESNSFLTVFYFSEEGWKYGIIEYEYPDLQAIDWDNEHWNEIMEDEIIGFFEHTIHLRDKK